MHCCGAHLTSALAVEQESVRQVAQVLRRAPSGHRGGGGGRLPFLCVRKTDSRLAIREHNRLYTCVIVNAAVVEAALRLH